MDQILLHLPEVKLTDVLNFQQVTQVSLISSNSFLHSHCSAPKSRSPVLGVGPQTPLLSLLVSHIHRQSTHGRSQDTDRASHSLSSNGAGPAAQAPVLSSRLKKMSRASYLLASFRSCNTYDILLSKACGMGRSRSRGWKANVSGQEVWQEGIVLVEQEQQPGLSSLPVGIGTPLLASLARSY